MKGAGSLRLVPNAPSSDTNKMHKKDVCVGGGNSDSVDSTHRAPRAAFKATQESKSNRETPEVLRGQADRRVGRGVPNEIRAGGGGPASLMRE